jgi:serine protease Do
MTTKDNSSSPARTGLAPVVKLTLLATGLVGAGILVYGTGPGRLARSTTAAGSAAAVDAVGAALLPAAEAASTAVTPKVEIPSEARALSRAFTAVAKALAPSVVRIEVEVGAPQAKGFHGRGQAPGQGLDENDIPPMFRHFFEFGPGGGEGGPSPGPQHGVGSGFIINDRGDIVTNRHVVQGATKVTVTMNDGKEYPARVVGKDVQTDVAVVRLERPPGNLVVSRLGDSDKLEVGEWVVAAGSPLGL